MPSKTLSVVDTNKTLFIIDNTYVNLSSVHSTPELNRCFRQIAQSEFVLSLFTHNKLPLAKKCEVPEG